jgi:excisionase family DNA binding protein
MFATTVPCFFMLFDVGAYRAQEDRMNRKSPSMLTVEQAAVRLGIGRGLAYEAVRRGQIPSIRIGRRVLVPLAALERFELAAYRGDGKPHAKM